MLIFSPIQTTLESPSRELMLDGIIRIIKRYFVVVLETDFRGVALLLLQVINSISRAECFQLPSQLPKRYLHKVLVIETSDINLLFDTWVVPNYQLSYLMFNAVINYYPRSFVQIVTNTIISPLIKP